VDWLSGQGFRRWGFFVPRAASALLAFANQPGEQVDDLPGLEKPTVALAGA